MKKGILFLIEALMFLSISAAPKYKAAVNLNTKEVTIWENDQVISGPSCENYSSVMEAVITQNSDYILLSIEKVSDSVLRTKIPVKIYKDGKCELYNYSANHPRSKQLYKDLLDYLNKTDSPIKFVLYTL